MNNCLILVDLQNDYFPGGNTAAGQNALFNLREGTFNTAVGLLSLNALIDGSFNTGVGAGAAFARAGLARSHRATGA